VFFFISSVGFALLTLVLVVALIYIIKILRDIKYISQKAKNEADILSGELSELRQNVREQGAKLKYFTSFFNSVYKKSKKT
ncbi:MAG: hypothetical protein KGJ93_01580, partial [Patescibacteria group bacterium]|nr:hypothetical protein [Patescibacteria group bacterium]